jgi:hypothetical protein
MRHHPPAAEHRVASVCHREPIVKIRVFSVACQRLVFYVYTYRKGQLKMTAHLELVNVHVVDLTFLDFTKRATDLL